MIIKKKKKFQMSTAGKYTSNKYVKALCHSTKAYILRVNRTL